MNLLEVESVDVTCVVDNSVDVLLPSTRIAKRPPVQDWFRKPLVAEHGFCAFITLGAGEDRQSLLFDSGLSSTAAANNLDALGCDLSSCSLVVSSHGHIDHTGGLLNVRKRLNKNGKVPLVLHPYAFRNRIMKFPDGRSLPLPAPRKDLLETGYEVAEKNSATLVLSERVLVTGEIPRTNEFEKGNPIHYSEIDGAMEKDAMIQDDQAIVMSVKDRGLIIVTGCGHAGIVNTINCAKELTGVDDVYSVIGGMHLSGGIFEPIISRTVLELQKIAPKSLVPCHCTGFKAVSELARVMPDRIMQNSVGTTYTF